MPLQGPGSLAPHRARPRLRGQVELRGPMLDAHVPVAQVALEGRGRTPVLFEQPLMQGAAALPRARPLGFRIGPPPALGQQGRGDLLGPLEPHLKDAPHDVRGHLHLTEQLPNQVGALPARSGPSGQGRLLDGVLAARRPLWRLSMARRHSIEQPHRVVVSRSTFPLPLVGHQAAVHQKAAEGRSEDEGRVFVDAPLVGQGGVRLQHGHQPRSLRLRQDDGRGRGGGWEAPPHVGVHRLDVVEGVVDVPLRNLGHLRRRVVREEVVELAHLVFLQTACHPEGLLLHIVLPL
mmetsp:Transcript_14201/g.40387  ORF Transcript_14201/g.40387 Transcript_14201/m.40387 type:complete len:291 (-) Transcript_14201:807-1679(-)